jgi:hypothetical protein
MEIRATSGTAGIGLHRSGFGHVGIYTDSTNQLKFNMNAGTPVLEWNAGTILGTGNYNSYAPTLTGGGASGTWGISISGGLTATIPTLGYTLSAATISYGGQAGPQILGQGGSGSIISFHRPGAYAVNFGLDTDNILKVGGWSMGAAAYPILHSNNYNSYAPTLTGGGASGTWGINITGNAATSTNGFFAWVIFDGQNPAGQPVSVNLIASYNVSSVTRNSAGNFGVSFTSSPPNTNYAVLTSASVGSTGCSARGVASTTVFSQTVAGAATNPAFMSVAIVR